MVDAYALEDLGHVSLAQAPIEAEDGMRRDDRAWTSRWKSHAFPKFRTIATARGCTEPYALDKATLLLGDEND